MKNILKLFMILLIGTNIIADNKKMQKISCGSDSRNIECVQMDDGQWYVNPDQYAWYKKVCDCVYQGTVTIPATYEACKIGN